MDVDDPRFSKLYTDPRFNIDPTAKEYKETEGTRALIDEKIKRRMKKQKKNNAKGDSW